MGKMVAMIGGGDVYAISLPQGERMHARCRRVRTAAEGASWFRQFRSPRWA